MIYSFDLRTVGFVVGLALLAGHLYALFNLEKVKVWLGGFARSKKAGTVLLSIVLVWSCWLVATMDLGEFTKFRMALLAALPVGFVLTLKFVDEFLAVRALGILLLLAADPLLCAAFLRPEITRLLLVVLAYAWIVKGLFWIGTPYLMRDQIEWLLARPSRLKAATILGIAYGSSLLIAAVVFFK